MPRLSCWFIRVALLYLVTGFTLGALMLMDKGLVVNFFPWKILPVHIETLLIGWLVQLALGTAYWILPRTQQGSPRGNQILVGISIVLLNLGIVCVASEAIFSMPGLAFIGRAAELVAVVAFMGAIWKRIKPFAA